MDEFYKIEIDPPKPENPHSRKPSNINDADIIHAQMMNGILNLIKERDEYYEDPSCLSKDIETVDLDGWSVQENYPLNFTPLKRLLRRTMAYQYHDIWYMQYPIVHEETRAMPFFTTDFN